MLCIDSSVLPVSGQVTRMLWTSMQVVLEADSDVKRLPPHADITVEFDERQSSYKATGGSTTPELIPLRESVTQSSGTRRRAKENAKSR